MPTSHKLREAFALLRAGRSYAEAAEFAGIPVEDVMKA